MVVLSQALPALAAVVWVLALALRAGGVGPRRGRFRARTAAAGHCFPRSAEPRTPSGRVPPPLVGVGSRGLSA